MQGRRQTDRRTDSWTAERIDLAVLAARAFSLHSAQNFLRLSGIDLALMQQFAVRFPSRLRASGSPHRSDRRSDRRSDSRSARVGEPGQANRLRS